MENCQTQLLQVVGCTNLSKNQSKVCLEPQKLKGDKNFYGSYPTEFAGSTQNFQKIFRTVNRPIKTKIFSKKICLLP
jgi:hypothetical protein